ncbi:MAG: 2-C-methyl-D-erythritol 4-phosphate cytidylyltransferase [Pseudonocardiales bacterium]|nr:2-C-methyl-D-erythritol 4-phosphate cytidylyltransferase [Pseudonocardiales bacterium]
MRFASISRRAVLAGFAGTLACVGSTSAEDRFITLASTTSTEQSGLFDHILPIFRETSGIIVRVVAVGTGQALAIGARGDVDAVLVHDVARPFVPAEVISRVVAALSGGAEAVIPVLPVVDTVKRVDESDVVVETLDRTSLRAVQTPQGFRRAVLVAAHAAAGGSAVTDDAALVEAFGVRVVVVEGADELFKITRPWDLALAALVAGR